MLIYRQVQRRMVRDVVRHGNLPLWLLLRCLPMMVATSLLLQLLLATPARALAVDAAALYVSEFDNVNSGQMVLRDPATGDSIPAVMQRSKVHFDISGLVAKDHG